ncbi:glycosyltransferase family 4 protein [Paenibacillus urinalis]|uniref:Glycosyltransferase family 4 protein n=1 Tax=Paenibacillus urinalis TaxID=521520 RepID=A0AAX3N2B5_9BACL|nr:glycosyltransferase family 4 protein [Paenibacillus urinalis]WDH83788.1 glycosyltransferase family 4 protein [Paenibacillus urinalis]
MKKIKVLFVNQTSRFGGAERVLHEYLVNLDRSVIEPIVIAPKGELTDNLKNNHISCVDIDEFEALESTRKKVNIKDLIRSGKLISKLNYAINSTNPDVIFTNSVKSHILVNLTKKKKPTILRLHDYPSSFGDISRKLLKHAAGNADQLSCVSHSVANDLSSMSADIHKRISVTYNGFTYHTNNEYITNHHSNRVVIAAWLLKWKGFNEFIDAMISIADKISWDFVIAGDVAPEAAGSKEYKEDLLKKIENTPHKSRFKLIGKYKNLSEVVCCPDHCIFVQPSIKPDPLPTVIFEAAQFRLPVITSSLGGSKEIINDSVSGYLIEPKPSQIAEKVLLLANSIELRRSLGSNLYSNCLESFTTDKYVNDLTKTIIKVAGGK